MDEEVREAGCTAGAASMQVNEQFRVHLVVLLCLV